MLLYLFKDFSSKVDAPNIRVNIDCITWYKDTGHLRHSYFYLLFLFIYRIAIRLKALIFFGLDNVHIIVRSTSI